MEIQAGTAGRLTREKKLPPGVEEEEEEEESKKLLPLLQRLVGIGI